MTKRKDIKTRDPVNINCTWHWINVHGKKKKKKIYTFIILKIEEVPPVIIKSTVESERLENLNVLSTGFQHPENTVLFIYSLFFCSALKIQFSHRRPATASALWWIWRNTTGEVLRCRHQRGGSSEAVRWGTKKKKKKKHHPPQTHTHPTNPKVPSHTPDVELRGVFLCVLVPFINQPSILHKNMEELLFPTIHSIYNGSSAQQQKKRVNGKTRN